MQYERLFYALLPSVFEAGKAIMEIYNQDFDVEHKSDSSPVTAADKIGEKILLEGLNKAAPDIPVVAEEAASEGKIPEVADQFFLVDPLDGTKEFINKRDEFTVNIGLIENRQAVFGIVYAPALGRIYYSLSPNHAYEAELAHNNAECELKEKRQISTQRISEDGYVVVASRSHLNDATKAFLDKHSVISTKSAGSSLKFCLLATGEADLYPRLSPTMEWDTAAGHAVLNAAGGVVLKEDDTPFEYGKAKDGFLNTSFVAWGVHR